MCCLFPISEKEVVLHKRTPFRLFFKNMYIRYLYINTYFYHDIYGNVLIQLSQKK